MNIYELHNNPQELVGFDDRWKLPENAWQKVFHMSRKGMPSSEFKQYEKYIAKGDYSSYAYATEIIGGKWPPGEQAIIDGHPNWAWKYVDNVLNEPWPAGEKTIFKDGWYRLKYKERFGWEPGEREEARRN